MAASSIFPPSAPNQRSPLRPWSTEDREALAALHAQRLSCGEIARRLDRTAEAVANMSRRLGLRRRDTAQPWTAEDLDLLSRLLDEGRSLREIAEATNHPRSSVADKLRRLSVTSRRFRRPWTDRERDAALALHREGASLAMIAAALPGRSLDAIQQKLQELVGPSPFRSARPRRADATPVAAPRPPVAVRVISRPPQPAFIAAGTDDMIRWLRSRDFMVLHRPDGWQVDRHMLDTEMALLEFVNTRRSRLNLPPFATRHCQPAMPAMACAAGD